MAGVRGCSWRRTTRQSRVKSRLWSKSAGQNTCHKGGRLIAAAAAADPSLDIVEDVPGVAISARRYIANLICDNNLYVNISMLYVLHPKNPNSNMFTFFFFLLIPLTARLLFASVKL